MERATLAQLRSGYCKLLGSYKSRIKKDDSVDVCADCGQTPHDVKHLFACPVHPTTLIPSDLWSKPVESIREFSYLEEGNLDWDEPRPKANNNNYNHTMSSVTGQSLYTALTVIYANIEGLTAAKVSILSEMCKRVLSLPVSPRNTPIHQPPTIARMSLVVERPHKYGSAILIRNDLKVKKIYERVQGTVEIITIVMPGVVVLELQATKTTRLNSQLWATETYHILWWRLQQPQYYVGQHKHR